MPFFSPSPVLVFPLSSALKAGALSQANSRTPVAFIPHNAAARRLFT